MKPANDYALIWNDITSLYDVYKLQDAKTMNNRVCTLSPDMIFSHDEADINDRIMADWDVEKHGTG